MWRVDMVILINTEYVAFTIKVQYQSNLLHPCARCFTGFIMFNYTNYYATIIILHKRKTIWIQNKTKCLVIEF